MHFMSSLKLGGMSSSSPQDQRSSDESHPTQLLQHPHQQRHVALQKPCLKVRAPHYYPYSSATQLSITQLLATVPITSAGWSTAQDPERKVLHLEQDVLLKLKSRWVWDRQLSLSHRNCCSSVHRRLHTSYNCHKANAGIKKWEWSCHWDANNSSAAFPNNPSDKVSYFPAKLNVILVPDEPWLTKVHFPLVDVQGEQYNRIGV